LFEVSPNEVFDERAYTELRWSHEFESDWTVQARGYFDHWSYEANQPFDGSFVDPSLAGQTVRDHDLGLAHSAGGGIQAGKTFFERHRITAGVEGCDDFEISGRNYVENPPVTVENRSGGMYNTGVYGQEEFSILTNLVLHVGARYDYYSTFGDTFNPRAGLVYTPWNPTTFKLLFGQAYRAPNAFEYGYAAPGYIPNPNLKPETIRTYELNWEERLSKPLRLSAGVFYNDVTDQIVQVNDSSNPAAGGWIFENVDHSQILGAEAELEGRWAWGLRGRLSYTYADARDAITEAWLPNSPRHVGKINLAVPLYREKVFAGVELQGLSRRLSDDGAASTPGYVIANATLFSRELVKGLELSASLYNLLDKHYSDPVGPDFSQRFIEQDGRSFRVKLTYRF
jgi:iron complex outermembrane receptor protein